MTRGKPSGETRFGTRIGFMMFCPPRPWTLRSDLRGAPQSHEKGTVATSGQTGWQVATAMRPPILEMAWLRHAWRPRLANRLDWLNPTTGFRYHIHKPEVQESSLSPR